MIGGILIKLLAFCPEKHIISSERVCAAMRTFERRTIIMAAAFGIFGALYLAGMIAMTVRGLHN